MRQVPTTVDPLASQGAVAAAQALAALGHEARLAIFRSLVRAGDAGLAVHQIQQGLGGIPRSTLAHHLQMLVQAGLVEQRKVGAEVESRADFRAMPDRGVLRRHLGRGGAPWRSTGGHRRAPMRTRSRRRRPAAPLFLAHESLET
jgi:ArsR family transcriptional regulator, arsenate/arsenite/antimonite-responsive transcriptional repressor